MNLTEQDLRAHARQRELSEWLAFSDDVGKNLALLEETLEPAFDRVETSAEAAVLNFSITQKNGYLARALGGSGSIEHTTRAQTILDEADRLSKGWRPKA